MKSLVFDTSYLVRLYLEDAGFEKVRDLAASASVISMAQHGHSEIVAAFHRIHREKRIDKKTCLDLLDQFSYDVTLSLFCWLELNERVRKRVVEVFRKAPAILFLRAADALHLAAAAEHGFSEIYSNDRHLLEAAPLFGLKGKNPIG